MERIRDIIKLKKSNICLSLDYRLTKDIINTINILKKHIIIVKLHCDIIEDFSQDFIKNLLKLCKEEQILIFEDRKFADIGNTFKYQFIGGIFKIRDWADIITLHGLSGEGQIIEFNKLRRKDQYALLVAQMSNRGNLFENNYTEKLVKLAQNNNIIGLVCQEKLSNNILHFTPGIKIERGNDNSDQIYKSPSEAIKKGSDIIIVGRGIISSPNILETCIRYKKEAWEIYKENLKN